MAYFKTENGNAENIKYDNTKSVKEAIDEIKDTAMFIDSFDTNTGTLNTTSVSGGSSSNPTAASVTFDNTDTGLNATNVQDAVTEVNGKLANYGNDKNNVGKLISFYDNYVLDMFKKASNSYSPAFGQLDIGGPVVAYIMQKHSDYYGGAVIVFGYNNRRPIYYHIVNGTIDAEYYL